jgi:hypothetical protein
MSQSRVELADIELPVFGLPEAQPDIPAAEHGARLAALEARYLADGHEAFLVYADREHFANEDGIALADEALRADMAAMFPEGWARIEARRAFMADVLGIRLKPEVLPFSNMPAYLPPFWLAPERAMRVAP